MNTRVERVAAALSQSQLARWPVVPPSRRIDEHRDEIRALVAAHHAVEPRVFGSTARGEDAIGSDVDLLVQFTEEASLLDEVGLCLALSDLLQVDVDVVGVDTLRGPIRERILREAVAV